MAENTALENATCDNTAACTAASLIKPPPPGSDLSLLSDTDKLKWLWRVTNEKRHERRKEAFFSRKYATGNKIAVPASN